MVHTHYNQLPKNILISSLLRNLRTVAFSYDKSMDKTISLTYEYKC